jgi:hypothetical protein
MPTEPPYTYYFINHTRKEFALFAKQYTILTALAHTVKTSLGWTLEDDIRIGSEGLDNNICLEYLDELRYNLAKLT